MFTELKSDLDLAARNKAAGWRATDPGVRLKPLPAKNTLLTIIFFSAVAAAILYWIVFPPAAPTLTEKNAAAPAVTSEVQPLPGN